MARKSTSNFTAQLRFLLVGCALSVAFGAMAAEEGGADAAAFDEEERFIQALQQAMMPDIAEEVIADARKRFPESQYPDVPARLKVCEIRGQLSQGKFEDVKKVIAAIPNKNGAEYWAMNLALADSYYAFSQFKEADALYLSFFNAVKKPDGALLKFYRESAGKYVMMLLRLNRNKDALTAYDFLLSVPIEKDLKRRAQAEKTELLLKLAPEEKDAKVRAGMLKQAEKLTDELLWEQDIWFGKAIVMKAHICMLNNDTAGAKKLVETYMPQLKTIHDALKEQDPDGSLDYLRLSPMPQCRYLLALMLFDTAREEAKASKPDEEKIKACLLGERDPQTKKRKGDGAFNHFLNVFIRFPESQWASDAGEKSEAIRRFIKERYHSELKTPVTAAQLTKVRQMQYDNASLAFKNHDYKLAIKKYLPVLNQFPETAESVAALGDLAESYVQESNGKADDINLLYADTVVGHLAERFSGRPEFLRVAGDQVRRIADIYGDLKLGDQRRATYQLFFAAFPTHFAAGQLVMSFGERDFANKNYKGALEYYNQIKTTYTNSTYYFEALNRIATIAKEQGDAEGEIAAREYYLGALQKRGEKSSQLVVAQFQLADAQRERAVAMTKELQLQEEQKGAAVGTNAVAAAAPEGATNAASNPETVQKQITVLQLKAVKGFKTVSDALTTDAAAYQKTGEEKKLNAQISENAAFLQGVILAQMRFPEKNIPAFRKMAIKAFEDYVKAFPQGKFASRALLQVGTIYTILQDVKNANEAFDKLQQNYPSSIEAKNSVPMLAASLIEMGLKGEGVAKYKQMFTGGGKYTPGQYLAAAEALFGAREYEMSMEAYGRVAAASKEEGLLARSELGRAQCLNGLKRYSEARKVLEVFGPKGKYGKMQLAVDANLLMVDVASAEGATERNDLERTRLFNEAVDALKMVRAYTTPRDDNGKAKDLRKWTKEEVAKDAELGLQAAEMLIRKLKAEQKLDLKEKAADTRGKAIVQLQGIIMPMVGALKGNEKLGPVLEKAYVECLPLLLEHKAFQDAEDDCNVYLQLFPDGKYRTDVQNFLNQAKIGK